MSKVITKSGLDILESSLKGLLKEREETLIKLEEARQMGDLKENSDYQLAREELAFIDKRISDIERELSESKLVEDKVSDKGSIDIGSYIVILDESGREFKIKLVSSVESDPNKLKISIESPLGQAVLNKKKGSTIVVKPDLRRSPAKTYKILDIIN